MSPLITFGFSLEDIKLWVEQSRGSYSFCTTAEATIRIQPDLPPSATPAMNRLRQEFVEIPRLPGRSHDILEFMLHSPDGLATYQELADNLWDPYKYPTEGCVRRAGIYSFVPTTVEVDQK